MENKRKKKDKIKGVGITIALGTFSARSSNVLYKITFDALSIHVPVLFAF